MWPVELVQCIKCEGNRYFIWKLPIFFNYTSPLLSLVTIFWPKWLIHSPPRSVCSLGSSSKSFPWFPYRGTYQCVRLGLVRSRAHFLLESGLPNNIPHPSFSLSLSLSLSLSHTCVCVCHIKKCEIDKFKYIY